MQRCRDALMFLIGLGAVAHQVLIVKPPGEQPFLIAAGLTLMGLPFMLNHGSGARTVNALVVKPVRRVFSRDPVLAAGQRMEAAAMVLRDMYANGDLTLDEFSRRLDEAAGAAPAEQPVSAPRPPAKRSDSVRSARPPSPPYTRSQGASERERSR